MDYQRRLPFEFSVKELDRELIASSVQISGERRFEFRDMEGDP